MGTPPPRSKRLGHLLKHGVKRQIEKAVSLSSDLGKQLATKIFGERSLKIAFFAGDLNNFTFVQGVIAYLLAQGHEVRIVEDTGLSADDLHAHMAWSDVSWFEWGNGPIVSLSHMPKVCGIVVRIHRYELYTDQPSQIHWPHVDHLVFVSEAAHRTFKERHLADIDHQVTVHVVPNAVDTARYHLSPKEKGFNIAVVARFNKDKNLPLVIQIMAKLVERDPRYRCYIAGGVQDEPLYQYCLRLIEQLSLTENVVICGRVENIDHWLDDKHFILSTSIIEGHPVNILEAMARGLKPVLHNYFGDPAAQFGAKYVFNTVDEAVEMFLSEDYRPAEYRDLILQRYEARDQAARFEAVIRAGCGQVLI